MNATEVVYQTLLGVLGQFPLPRGNCFAVGTEEGEFYHVINIVLENLGELIRRGEVSWPIEIEPVGKSHARVIDARIPVDWLTDRYCDVCYPPRVRQKQREELILFPLQSGGSPV